MANDQLHMAERAHAFVVLMAIGGATAVANAVENVLEGDSAGMFDGNQQQQPPPIDVNIVKPALSVDEMANRFHVTAGLHNASNFIALALFSFADILVVLAILAFTQATLYVLPSLFDDMMRRFNAPRHVRSLIKTSLQVLIGIAGIWLALSAIGINFLGIILSFGVVSIVLSNGVGTAISNAVAGILHNTDDLQPGSRISIYNVSGVIEETGFFTIRLRVENDNGGLGSDIFVVPNNSFLQTAWYVRPPLQPRDDEPDDLDSKNLGFLRSQNFSKANNTKKN